MNPKDFVVHFKKKPYDVYIGRPSKWGNPFSHLDKHKGKETVASREEAIEKYKEWLVEQDDLMNSLHELKGKILGCWCSPKACHGEVLALLANDDSWRE
jgi:hypothetical protein